MEEKRTNITMKNAAFVGISQDSMGIVKITLQCTSDDFDAIINDTTHLEVTIRKK